MLKMRIIVTKNKYVFVVILCYYLIVSFKGDGHGFYTDRKA